MSHATLGKNEVGTHYKNVYIGSKQSLIIGARKINLVNINFTQT